MMQSRVAVLIAVGLLSTGLAHASPAVKVSPKSGHPQVTIQVDGSGFAANEAVDIYFDTTDILLAATGGTGSFANYPIAIPAGALPGRHWITAVGRKDGAAAQAAVTVRTNWSQSGFTAATRYYNPWENVVSPSTVDQLSIVWSAPANAPNASPAVAGGVVYVTGSSGNVYAISEANGAAKWTAHVCTQSFATPAIAGGVVYVACFADGKVYALNATDGSQKWTTPLAGHLNGSVAVAGGMAFAVSDNGDLYALDASTGALKWTGTTGASIHTPAAAANGLVYVGSLDDSVYAFDAVAGTKVWSHATGNQIFGTPAIAFGAVYIGSADGNLYALEAHSGTIMWKFNTGVSIVGSPALALGHVYICNSNGVYSVSEGSGKLLWSSAVGLSGSCDVSVANGVVYVASPGLITALDAAVGTTLWEAATPNPTTPPTITDGILYVPSAPSQDLLALALNGGNDAAYRRNSAPPSPSSLHPDRRLQPAKAFGAQK